MCESCVIFMAKSVVLLNLEPCFIVPLVHSDSIVRYQCFFRKTTVQMLWKHIKADSELKCSCHFGVRQDLSPVIDMK